MGRADERRAGLVDALADHLLAEGLAGASLRPLARAAGVSDRMLLYYFADKDAVLAAALGRVAERMTALLDARAAPEPQPFEALLASLHAVLLAEEFWPYMALWLDLASAAARGEPQARALGEAIGRGFLAWGGAQLASDQPERDAARLLAMVEGMVLLRALGLSDVAERAL